MALLHLARIIRGSHGAMSKETMSDSRVITTRGYQEVRRETPRRRRRSRLHQANPDGVFVTCLGQYDESCNCVTNPSGINQYHSPVMLSSEKACIAPTGANV